MMFQYSHVNINTLDLMVQMRSTCVYSLGVLNVRA